MGDVMGEDHVMSGQGSGWFWYDCTYNVKLAIHPGHGAPMIYGVHTINGLPMPTTSLQRKKPWKVCPAMSITLLDRDMLSGHTVTLCSFSHLPVYKGHESDPGVPIYTEPSAAGTEGQPRSTVQQVYDLIVADIEKAVALLKEAKPQIHKSHIDYHVAQVLQPAYT